MPDRKLATYNITDDRLRAWFPERLSETDYDEMRRAGFVYWRGTQCFTTIWSPQAEDLLTQKHGFQIEEDDTPDDPEARVARFQSRALEAQSNAERAAAYGASEQANTERRRANAAKAEARELSAAEHWQRRIEGAIRHAGYKQQPGVIARRIAGLEADQRRSERDLLDAEKRRNFWTRSDLTVDDATQFANYYDHGSMPVAGKPFPAGFWVCLHDGLVPLDEVRAYALTLADKDAEHARRSIEHIENRLLYERAMLAATDSLQATMAEPAGVTFEVGGALRTDESWYEITKVNPSTIEVFDRRYGASYRKIDRSEIKEVASKLRVDAGEVHVAQRAPVIAKKAPTQSTTRDGRVPEKLGAVGIVPGFTFNPKPEEIRWMLISRVDRKSIECIQKIPGERAHYRAFKHEIYGLHHLKTAAEVAAEFPQFLAEYAEFTTLKKRLAEKRRALTAAAVEPPAEIAV